MARLQGLEPRTHCLEGSCSIHLSYKRNSILNINIYQVDCQEYITKTFLKNVIYA